MPKKIINLTKGRIRMVRKRSWRSPIIGFYKDSKGRTRPITPRKGRRFRRVFIDKVSFLQGNRARKLFLNVISPVLSQASIAKEIYTAYILADALYKNWSLIAQLYDTYEKRGWQGVTDAIVSDVAHNTLSSVQTNIAWATINSFIPKEYHNTGKQILADVMDCITSEEIKLVKQFLQQSEKWKSDDKLSYENTLKQQDEFFKMEG
ncbi:MAG: hypothetical protein QW272_05215 [Candidatus Methanomethylicaceae archaeon]